jgi:hypothetical protein
MPFVISVFHLINLTVVQLAMRRRKNGRVSIHFVAIVGNALKLQILLTFEMLCYRFLIWKFRLVKQCSDVHTSELHKFP